MNAPIGALDARECTAPMMMRAASVRPQSYREEDHSVEICWSTGAAGLRFDWYDGEYYIEELSMEPSAVRLDRLNAGAVSLDSHQTYSLRSVLGSIVPGTAHLENGEGIARVRLSRAPNVADIVQNIVDGHIRNVSVGYNVYQYLRTEEPGQRPHMLATDWEPTEVSFVTVPFDAGAQVRTRSAEQGGYPCTIRGAAAASQENDMPDPVIEPAADTAPPVEQNRTQVTPPTPPAPTAQPAITATRILERCGRSDDLGSEFAAELIRENESTPLSEADFERRISDRLIERRAQPPLDVRAGRTLTESDGYRRAIETAVILRADPSVQVEAADAEAAREFRGMSLMELSRDYLERTGIRTGGMGRLELAGAALGLRYGAMTTSDFANALSNATSRRVREAYAAAPQTFGPIVSRGTLPDFKDTNIIGLGDAPQLLLVKENAEFTYGALADTGMTYRLQTYGRIIAITRQALINDDKQLFGRIPAMFGRKAADLESDLVWGTLVGNPTLADGIALFHASHGNLMTGAAITVASVGLAEQAMLNQTSAEGGYLTIRPQYLIVGTAKKVEAQQFLTAVAAAQTSNVNPFPGTLTLIVEPRIPGNSWYLAADPAAADTIEFSHLDGQESLFTETQPGFDVDGVKTKARLDVGAAPIDYRGLVKNPGN
ncbi:prohead protease/major capsid protein fusion protein [Rhizorhabdus histidinilytica]|uniref:prohead protease/major capsid protein fusion protein n=1 Tax=Rhizorhabdus histidinilytica TaxID=439228 RepID=UPI00321FADA2